LIRIHRISYDYLRNLWELATDRRLEPPDCPLGRKQAIERAAALMNCYPSLANDIVSMFALTARERARAVSITNHPTGVEEHIEAARAPKPRPKKPKRALTPYQASLIRAIKQHRNARATVKQIAKVIGSTPAPRSIVALKDHGLIQELKSGHLKLTASGRRANV
jgi:hypothetical protein